MSSCKCLNPDGGGTTCPAQHIAICTRWKDGECYGECIPIPKRYSFVSNELKKWIEHIVEANVLSHVDKGLRKGVAYPLRRIERLTSNFNDKDSSGQMAFNTLGAVKVQVRFSVEFSRRNSEFDDNENFNVNFS